MNSKIFQEVKSTTFTPQMRHDQDYLVTTLAQQGESEPVIRRHLDRLIEEQTKQLQFFNYNCDYNNSQNQYPKKSSSQTINSRVTADIPNQRNQINNEEKQNEADQTSDQWNLSKVEPLSLIKLKMEKESRASMRKNNGLQDDSLALEIVNKHKYGHSNERNVKFNGTQNREDLPNEYLQAIQDTEQKVKKVPFNGLENFRRPNNPPMNSKSRAIKELLKRKEPPAVYPPQKNLYSCNNRNYQSQSRQESNYQSQQNQESNYYQNRKVQSCEPNVENHRTSNQSMVHPQFTETSPNYAGSPNNCECCTSQINNSQQQQQLNTVQGFQEPRIIGGVTYYARNPQCIPQIPGFRYDNYSCVNHLNTTSAR